MARISGVDIPREKRLEISLTYIYGIGRTLRGGLGRELRRERRALARPLESHVARGRPRQRVALLVGERDDRVVERRLDVCDAVGDVLALFALGPTSAGRRLCHFPSDFRY